MNDLHLTNAQIDRLLEALTAGREDDPPTGAEARDWLAWAESTKRDIALLVGALEGRLRVRQVAEGWRWEERDPE